ncbi:hypothetical protein Leryth_010210 [Lithospermum erythrorhizon]|nr:hypothetical protein Leryth_010210 [Lithospermum erythrorhizon]
MNLSSVEDESAAQETHVPAEVHWEMLDKSKFFVLGAALFSGVSAALYPAVVLKTRQQVAQLHVSCTKTAIGILKHEGPRGLYRGFGTSLMGTIPARALYMTALEVTKSNVGVFALKMGFAESSVAAIANAAAGLSAAVAAQLVWTPVDVVSQRLMVQGDRGVCRGDHRRIPSGSMCKYQNGFDAFRKILHSDGPRGLYRGFGISILTYAPSNAVWWASYSVTQRVIWGGIGWYSCKKQHDDRIGNGMNNSMRRDAKTVMAVQGVSAAKWPGVPQPDHHMLLDTIKI